MSEFDEEAVLIVFSTNYKMEGPTAHDFIEGARWMFEQTKSREAELLCTNCGDGMTTREALLLDIIRGMLEALKVSENRYLDWDMMHQGHSLKLLQDWRGKCFEAIRSADSALEKIGVKL